MLTLTLLSLEHMTQMQSGRFILEDKEAVIQLVYNRVHRNWCLFFSP
jgi:hypothetical protein